MTNSRNKPMVTQDSHLAAVRARSLWQEGCSEYLAGSLGRAADCFLLALKLDPGNAKAHFNLGVVHGDSGDIDSARESFETAARLAPTWIDPIAGLASIHERLGDVGAAAGILQRGLTLGTMNVNLALVYARVFYQAGRSQDALPMLADFMDSLRPTSHAELLYFAYGDVLHECREYERAFAAYEQGNRLCRLRVGPPRSQMLDELVDLFNVDRLASMPTSTCESKSPVFIVGMPRSGTSLLEQMLGRHHEIFPAGELSTVDELVHALPESLDVSNSQYSACLNAVTTSDWNALAESYLRTTSALSNDSAFVTDKMPGNFVHLGVIASVFPRALIVHMRRDPLDLCFSCFTRSFSAGHVYSTDLNDLGEYFSAYQRLMRHWDSSLGARIITVQYESLVTRPRHEVERILARLELPWDKRCLEPHKAERTIQTASYAQVRSPINRTSIGKSSEYRRWLGPLIRALSGAKKRP